MVSNCRRKDHLALWRGFDRSLVQLCIGARPNFSYTERGAQVLRPGMSAGEVGEVLWDPWFLFSGEGSQMTTLQLE
eukprot:10762193-Alexandrium_andersonii.AAC.1